MTCPRCLGRGTTHEWWHAARVSTRKTRCWLCGGSGLAAGAGDAAMSTPIENLRKHHKPCEPCIYTNHWFARTAGTHCQECLDTWPCDTVAALDALEAERDELRARVNADAPYSSMMAATDRWQRRAIALQARLDAVEKEIQDLLALRPTRGQLFQRLDAATELIRQGMETAHILHFVKSTTWPDLAKPDIDTCPNCRPYREWLGGKDDRGE